jgi:hypothetical protein
VLQDLEEEEERKAQRKKMRIAPIDYGEHALETDKTKNALVSMYVCVYVFM